MPDGVRLWSFLALVVAWVLAFSRSTVRIALHTFVLLVVVLIVPVILACCVGIVAVIIIVCRAPIGVAIVSGLVYLPVEFVYSFESHGAVVSFVVVVSGLLFLWVTVQLHSHSKAEVPDVRAGEQRLLIILIVNTGGYLELIGNLVVLVEFCVGEWSMGVALILFPKVVYFR